MSWSSDDDGEVVDGGAVGAQQDQVVQLLVGGDDVA